jgi:hypothetical protein
MRGSAEYEGRSDTVLIPEKVHLRVEDQDNAVFLFLRGKAPVAEDNIFRIPDKQVRPTRQIQEFKEDMFFKRVQVRAPLPVGTDGLLKYIICRRLSVRNGNYCPGRTLNHSILHRLW